MNWAKRLRTFSRVFVCLAALAMSGCGSTEDSPTGPTATSEPGAATPAPDPAPAPEPGTPGLLNVTITPNPVPRSSEPAPTCNLANRWHYEQTLRNTGGTRVTISDRADSFDGVEVSKRGDLGIVLEPGAEAAISTEWCSPNNIEHRARTSFSGSDDSGNRVTFAGTTVRLLPR